MDNRAREALREIIVNYGRMISEDPRRCRSLLLDMCGEQRREINVLVSALEERVASDLLNSTGKDAINRVPTYELLQKRLVKRLYENRGLAEEFGVWAVDSWALALGVIASAPRAETRVNEGTTRTGAEQHAPTEQVPTVIVARQGGQYSSIQQAVDSVPPNTRILVRPGTYSESVVLNKRVEIVGDGPRHTIVVESRNAECFLVKTNKASISGLTLRCAVSGNNQAYYTVDIEEGELLLEECDITSSSSACVGVHGTTTNPTIRKCVIHDGAASGIFIHDYARGHIFDCDIYGNTLAGIEIKEGSSPLIQRCAIHDGNANGISVHTRGLGRIEDCDIYGNFNSCIEIKEDSAPLVRRCKIHDGASGGIFVHSNGQGRIEDCEIYGNVLAGVSTKSGGNPMVYRCKMRDGKASGISIYEKGAGQIEECDVYGNINSGITIQDGGSPVVFKCTIHDGVSAGVYVQTKGEGRIEECDIYGNKLAGAEIHGYGNPYFVRCKFHAGKQVAVYVHSHGHGRFTDCDMRNSPRGVWYIEAGCTVVREGNKE